MKRIYLALESDEIIVNDFNESEHTSFMEGARFVAGYESIECIGTGEEGAFIICQKLLERRISSSSIVEELNEFFDWDLSTEHIAYNDILYDCYGNDLYISTGEQPEPKVEVIEINCDEDLNATGEDVILPSTELEVTEDGQYD